MKIHLLTNCHAVVAGKLIPFLENVVGNASAVTILAISVERYRVACRTLTQSTASPSSMFKTSLLIWLTAILAALPFIFITSYTRSMFVDGTSVPVCKTPVDQLWHRVGALLNKSVPRVRVFRVMVYVFDISQPSLPTPFYSVLVSVSVLTVPQWEAADAEIKAPSV